MWVIPEVNKIYQTENSQAYTKIYRPFIITEKTWYNRLIKMHKYIRVNFVEAIIYLTHGLQG